MDTTPLSLDDFFKLPKPTTEDEADDYADAFHRIPWPQTYEDAKRYLEAENMVGDAFGQFIPELPPDTPFAERVRLSLEYSKHIRQREQAKKRATDHPVQ